MKKLLLLAAGAMLVSSAAMAEETTVIPTVYPNYMLSAISPNGEWTVSVDQMSYLMTIINVKTGETWEYGGDGMETYNGGMCHYVSDNGVVVSTVNESYGVYWANGAWNYLPCKDTDFASYPNAISADGSVIAGSVSHSSISLDDSEDVMTSPVVWYRKADGTYGDYVELPYPHRDWTGRVPQYALIDDISADGNVCAGCVTDYSGRAQMPIIFTQKDNGEWEYTLVHPELLNPENVEFPKYPGEAPKAPDPKEWMSAANADKYEEALEEYANRPYPQQEEYMTADELAAYTEALNAYYEDPYNNPYPFMSQFMSEAAQEAYDNAVNEYYSAPQPDPADYMSENQIIMYNMAVERYNIAATRWNEQYMAFEEAFEQVLSNPDVLWFVMNSAIISPNGKYLGMTAEKYVEDPNSWMGFTTVSMPCVFDLETGDYSLMDKGQDNVLAMQLSDEGYVLAAAPIGDYTRSAYIARGTDAAFEQLINIVEEKSPELYNWMKENMTHEVEDYIFDEETGDLTITTREVVAEGTTVANRDFTIFAGWVINNWDMMSENYAYSYLYGLNGGVTGIDTVSTKAHDFSVSAQLGGIININGEVANVTVYDITGRKVFSADAPASQVSTGLLNGTYVVTAKAANGQMVTKKVVF